MPNAGDRIIIEGTKLGQARREGLLLDRIGSLLKVRWNDGSESLLTPGAGTVQVISGSGSAGKKATKAAPAKAKKAKPKAKAAKKKPAKR